MTYMPFKDSNTKVSRVYKINQTSDKYEEDSNIDAEKFEKDNKPVYEENNMKIKNQLPIRFSGGIGS